MDFFNDDLLRFLSFNNAILSGIEDVIIVADPSGRVVYQNPAARRLQGYAEDPPFAADYLKGLLDGRNLMTVFAGASLALILTSALGVVAGSILSQYISEKALHYLAGIGFIAIGVWTLVKA